jgi:hypothetical protein
MSILSLLRHLTETQESIFASITDSDDQENSKSSVHLMSRVDFVYGLLKVALRNADDSVRNVCIGPGPHRIDLCD